MVHIQEITNGIRTVGLRKLEPIMEVGGVGWGTSGSCKVHGGGCVPRWMDGFSQVANPHASLRLLPIGQFCFRRQQRSC